MNFVRVSLSGMSIYGGILILTVLLLRMLLKNRLPKRTFSVLWCVALLRLLTPFSMDSSFSVLSLMQEQAASLQTSWAADGEDHRGTFAGGIFSEGQYSGGAFGYAGAAGGKSGAGRIDGMADEPAAGGPAAFYLWEAEKLSLFRSIGMAGTVVCAAVFLALYLNCLGRFRTMLPVENPFVEQWLDRNRLCRKVRVCQSDRISSPLTYGLVRPVILLPKRLGREDGGNLEYILQHEMVHIRRLDVAWKLVMTAALCLHWFNPLVWVMYLFMNRDLELSCDEEVLRIYGTGARKGYALTLLGMEEHMRLSVPLYSGFGKNAVEERIGEIMKYQKTTKAAIGAAAVLILAVACIFATTSRAGEDVPEADSRSMLGEREADLPMDPPSGNFGEMTGRDGIAGAGTADAADAGGVSKMAGRTDADVMSRPAGGMEMPAGGEDGWRLTYVKEGMPESEPARLVTGPGYSLLLPLEGWTSFGPDGWMSELNNAVEIWVAHFGAEGSDYEGFSMQQIVDALGEQGYQESENGWYWTYEEAKDRMMVVELHQSGGQDIWGVFYTYPGEGEDGWGVELRAMARTFAVAGPQSSGAGSGGDEAAVPGGTGTGGTEIEEMLMQRLDEEKETEAAKLLMQKLIVASGSQDDESIRQCMAQGCEADLDCLNMITEWKQEEMSVRLHPADGRCVASVRVITRKSEADSNDYLTVGMVKEEDGWKISFMGLEK